MINGIIEGQIGLFDLDIWSGKTFQEHSVQTEAKISKPSLKRSSKSSSRMSPICAQLCRGGGQKPDVSTLRWEHGALLGEYTTRSFGESPREENVSRLSQILEDSAHPKYSLSAKACQGILNRAERRKKELPVELKQALIAQSVSKETESTEPIPPDATEPDGAGGGSYTLNTIDRPAVMVFEQNQREEVRDLGGVSSAIKAEPGTHNQTFVAGFKAGQSKDGGIGYAEEQSPTLSATPSALEPTVICAGFVGNQGSKAHGIAYELEKSPTLRAGGVDRTA